VFGLSRHRPSNPGSIWLDEPKASRAIDGKLRSREITEAEAEHLRAFSENGYFTIPIELSAEDAAAIDRDIDRLWLARPANVSFAYDSPPRRFSKRAPNFTGGRDLESTTCTPPPRWRCACTCIRP
jgi:hypothetical protein